MADFGEALPTIRETTDGHLSLRGLPKEKILAAVVWLIDRTLIRVGNGQYAIANETFGLTTLQARHVTVSGWTIRLKFNGKWDVPHDVEIHDRRIAAIVKQCLGIQRDYLFGVTSDEVNAYIAEISGGDFTAKDFRTWGGTVLAATALRKPNASASDAYEAAAAGLRNGPNESRDSYVHPGIVVAFTDGTFQNAFRAAERRMQGASRGLTLGEEAVLLLID